MAYKWNDIEITPSHTLKFNDTTLKYYKYNDTIVWKKEVQIAEALAASASTGEPYDVYTSYTATAKLPEGGFTKLKLSGTAGLKITTTGEHGVNAWIYLSVQVGSTWTDEYVLLNNWWENISSDSPEVTWDNREVSLPDNTTNVRIKVKVRRDNSYGAAAGRGYVKNISMIATA